jgi:hypothetical protein
MNDRRINNLVRMAAEIDELERSALDAAPAEPRMHAPQLRLVDRDQAHRLRRERRAWVVRAVLMGAAAASVGLAVRLSLPTFTHAPSPTPPIVKSPVIPLPKTEVAVAPTPKVPPVAPHLLPRKPDTTTIAYVPPPTPGADDAAVVLAIFEDAGGIVRCVRWHEHDFGERGLEHVRRSELLAATYGDSCVVGPHRLIAVGLTGPRDELPNTEERAQAMAQCIIGSQKGTCDIEPASYNSKSMTCLPHGLKMMVETLAMGKP